MMHDTAIVIRCIVQASKSQYFISFYFSRSGVIGDDLHIGIPIFSLVLMNKSQSMTKRMYTITQAENKYSALYL